MKYITYTFLGKYYGGPSLDSRFLGAIIRNTTNKILINIK